jgi:PAS domain S-box-containing protein
MEWVHCHIARQAVSPSDRLNRVPTAVSAIVMKLLAKTAEERYQTAAGVEFDLRRCLADWESVGHIDPFPLAGQDISDRLLVPEKLYGRDAERKVLLDAFDRVAASGKMELVLVSGYSGIGKSSIVYELGKTVVLRRGIFISGKVDQQKRDIPYYTFAQAFQGLVRQILSKSEEEVGRWRDAIREVLGTNGQLIVNLVPELELIIGQQSAVPDLPLEAAQNRFQMTFLRFLRGFARAEHVVTLFLDDLQWLDAATLELLNRLATELDGVHLLVVGAHRDNEVGSSHPLARTLERIRRGGATVHEIVLRPLLVGDVGELVKDALHCGVNRAKPLAELVHEKTGGNPFFAIQFLTALAEDGLLSFDSQAAAWTWDLSRVQARCYSDNVVELMTDKLRRLPQSTQEVLKQLACLGNSAKIATLDLLYEQTEESIQPELWHAIRAGLVFNLEGTYSFLHDRIREAAYSLIPESERTTAHCRIGRLLVSSLTAEEIGDEIFEIVNHLKLAAPLITAPEERKQVVELNLIAAKRAKQSEAYVSALNYLAECQALLAQDCWRRDRALAFDVMLNRAECEVRTGLLTEAEERLPLLFERAANRIEDSAVTCLRVALFMTHGQFDRAVEVCLEYLRRSAIDWSPHPTKEEVEREYAKVWQQIGSRAIEELVDLPLATDPDCRATQDVLAVLSTPAWFTDENLYELVGAHIANLSLEYGNCDGSCHGYARLGATLGPKLGEYQAGFRFGQLAIDLIERRRLYRFDALVYTAFGHHILPWSRHLKAGRPWNQRAFNAARESGNLAFAAFSSSNLIANLLAGGDPLQEVQQQAEIGLEFAKKMRFDLVSDYIISGLELIRTLRGLTPNFGFLTDEGFEESRFEQHLEESPRFAMAACRYWIRKLQARFYANDYAAAIAAAAKAQPLQIRRSFFEVAEYPFFCALAHAALCGSPSSRTSGPRLSGSFSLPAWHLETIATHHRQLVIWAENCPENFGGCAALVGAEIARIEGRERDAAQLYEQAIVLSREHGFVQNEAIAYEVGARFYSELGLETIARAYLRNACDSYLRWGALGKVKQLQQVYPRLKEETPIGSNTTIGAPIDQLDLTTVVKALQALSSEIVLEKLIDTLMRMVIEQAGAQRGLLILARDESQRIEAEATTMGDTIVVRLQDAPVTPDAAPESIIRYVARTRESVILDDALTWPAFSTDTYVLRQSARSVLCLPLINQAKLIGLLYLENHLSPNVFTPMRIAALNLLASQAAISLVNTRLYRDLEEREGKIRRLVDANIIGICIWNLEGEILEANDEFLQIVQYSREDLASRRLSWKELTPREWHQRVEEALIDLRTIGTTKPFHKEYIRKDGSRVPVLIGPAIFEGSGSEGVAFVLDLSEQKRMEDERKLAEEALLKAQAELAHMSRVTTLGELSASLAHEINQPLAALVTDAGACIRWLAAGNPEEARKCATRIMGNGNRASEIIRRIRALAKKTPPHKALIDLNEIIGEVLSIAGSEIRRNQVSLKTRLSQDLPPIMADKVQLQQVILNLLVNAVEAMSGMAEGPRELLLTSQRITEASPSRTSGSPIPPGLASRPASSLANDHALIAVHDSGPGLDPASLGCLFDAFYTTKAQGLGMGLAISRSIIEAHGGRLQAMANKPKGAIFHFTLPICDPTIS